MKLDQAEQVVQTLATTLSRKSSILVHRMSELKGYSFDEITIAMKLRVAREYQQCADDPTALAEFRKRVDSVYGPLAAGMRSQFVADSKIDAFGHLSPDSEEFKFAMTQLMPAWRDENDPDYQRWLQEETIVSFASYCQYIGGNDPLYWHRIYTHLGIPFEPNSSQGQSELVLDLGGSIAPRVPANQERATTGEVGNAGLIRLLLVGGIIVVVLYVIFS